MWVSISGESGSGKTTISHFIKKKYSWFNKIIHLDLWVKKIYKLKTVKTWLKMEFNSSPIIKNEKIDFTTLKKCLMQDLPKWKKLNNFLQPLIKKKLEKEKIKEKHCIVEGAIIFTSNLNSLMDKNIFIKSKKSNLWNRNKKFTLVEREKLWNFQKKIRSSEKKSDYIIENNKSKKELKMQIEKMKNFFLKQKLKKKNF